MTPDLSDVRVHNPRQWFPSVYGLTVAVLAECEREDSLRLWERAWIEARLSAGWEPVEN